MRMDFRGYGFLYLAEHNSGLRTEQIADTTNRRRLVYNLIRT